MLTQVCEKIQFAWTSTRSVNSNSSGWISGNAACCHHNGERPDSRGRGGLRPNSDGSVTYSCFNCGFKAHYRPGMILSHKFRKLLSWMGMDWDWVQLLVIESIRIRDLVPDQQQEQIKKVLEYQDVRSLPKGTLLFSEIVSGNCEVPNHLLTHLEESIKYLQSRNIDPFGEYEFAICDNKDRMMNQRILVPFYHNHKVAGYNSRLISKNHARNSRWFSDHPSNFVFNLDKQRDHEFILVFEGLFDAISLDGVSVLGVNKITDDQADFIENLGKPVIFVPQNDSAAWKSRSIDQVIEYGWSVSFPVWLETCKDANEAVVKYDRLFCLKAILEESHANPTKIKVMKKQFQQKYKNL